MREATNILLQTVPEDFNLAKMVKSIEKFNTVENVHHTHVWALTRGKNIVSMHVLVKDTTDQKRYLEKSIIC
ncbi:MAG: hypothetical protein B7X69_00965 [Sulfurovum sp. 39-42-12]|nr:MAG: hypothetical protein B7Y63_09545 [Sulfurovum sp. 35-42-20]OYZ23503.1 MAG: hypothetical protein B7Y23_10095 [Sulfurovum sp. 16-42-52]OYZ47663.1 MAG: hypothetical protein B7Y13_09640 [Sulfurovum sp. 24-42-9]OZA43066.1 MAG: hypothetical protein B7X80_09750 [Sulfurovum sp. 17-42-90]OZA61237.1 MAG: hypothetical protein B7X69_00965 [Sulfurovum sp. 39-42-12]